MVSSFPQTGCSICEVTLRWPMVNEHPTNMMTGWGWEWGLQDPCYRQQFRLLPASWIF